MKSKLLFIFMGALITLGACKKEDEDDSSLQSLLAGKCLTEVRSSLCALDDPDYMTCSIDPFTLSQGTKRCFLENGSLIETTLDGTVFNFLWEVLPGDTLYIDRVDPVRADDYLPLYKVEDGLIIFKSNNPGTQAGQITGTYYQVYMEQ